MPANEIILGIDLGTTFSSVAAWVGSQLHVVHDGSGDPRVPSIVYFPQSGEPLVGAAAAAQRGLDPENAVVGIKRILGRKHDSPEARILGAHTGFRTMEAPNGQVICELRGQQCSTPQIAAYILRHLKGMAERWFRRACTKAVITVPATANEEVRNATNLAARMAGLEVVSMVPEPCAGALAHHIHNFRGQRHVLVYDFGGGTFDVSVLRQTDGQFHIASVGGDDHLGGDDFDLAMANLVASSIWSQHEVDITNDVVRWDEILRTCERAKRALSISPTAPIRIRDAFSMGGRSHHIDLAMRRDELETRWKRYVDTSMKITAQTMMQAGKRPRDVEMVLIVGGATYTPLVRRSVERLLGQPRHDGADPQTAVACGAALLAASRVSLAA